MVVIGIAAMKDGDESPLEPTSDEPASENALVELERRRISDEEIVRRMLQDSTWSSNTLEEVVMRVVSQTGHRNESADDENVEDEGSSWTR